MKHLHHIVPKHMGGTDDPDNLVYLTVEEHALAHKKLYEEHGCWQDKLAWQGLSGLISKEEIMKQMYEQRCGEGNYFYGKKHTEETKRKISEKNTGKLKGRKQSPEHIEKRKRFGEENHAFGKPTWNKGKKGVQKKSLETKMKISKPCTYNGVKYWSIVEAARANKTSVYKLKKSPLYAE